MVVAPGMLGIRVKIYAYVNMLSRNDLITTICWKGKQSNRCKPATTRREDTTEEISMLVTKQEQRE